MALETGQSPPKLSNLTASNRSVVRNLTVLVMGLLIPGNSVAGFDEVEKPQSAAKVTAENPPLFQGNGIKVGAVTQDSAIIWTRLTVRDDLNLTGHPWPSEKKASKKMIELPYDKPLAEMRASMCGTTGQVRVGYWVEPINDSQHAVKKELTKWQDVDPNADFTKQFHLQNLKPGANYRVQVECRKSDNHQPGPTIQGSFRTAPKESDSRKISFAVVTGQDYPRRDDGPKGHRIYPIMDNMDLDFFVHTGDIEYYDKPQPFAMNKVIARFKWNRLFGLPHLREFHRQTSSYFLKDDHDTLKDDCWPGQSYGTITWEDGLKIFNEQFPVFRPNYQTIRWGKHLQVWLVEGRDFRSPNRMPDGPDKTIWGAKQKEWFFRTVSESDATFKILISPTPLVGPDRKGKGDNHANANFSVEGNQIREFISKQKNMFICCGDRHWQYVSVDDKTGVREFSCGPTSDKHAGGWSNKKRTPSHRYLNVVGGFLAVTIEPPPNAPGEGPPVAVFRHFSTRGKLLNEDRQTAK